MSDELKEIKDLLREIKGEKADQALFSTTTKLDNEAPIWNASHIANMPVDTKHKKDGWGFLINKGKLDLFPVGDSKFYDHDGLTNYRIEEHAPLNDSKNSAGNLWSAKKTEGEIEESRKKGNITLNKELARVKKEVKEILDNSSTSKLKTEATRLLKRIEKAEANVESIRTVVGGLITTQGDKVAYGVLGQEMDRIQKQMAGVIELKLGKVQDQTFTKAELNKKFKELQSELTKITKVSSKKGVDSLIKDLQLNKADWGHEHMAKQIKYNGQRLNEYLDGLTTGDALPDQTGNSGKFLTTDGSDASWAAVPGGGDMLASVYDPREIGADVFDVDNHTDGTTNKVFTATEKTKLSGIAESANNYSLPTAAAGTLGGVKVGTRLTITDGVLSADSQTENSFTTTLKNKLDGIEASADVTDATNVAAAGAVMDSELIATSAGAGDAGKPIKLDAEGHVDATMINDADISLDNVSEGTTNKFYTATEKTKLSGIETAADVTDATNVSAAGAPIITSGAGAPASTPAKVGDIYVDTTGDDAYIAVGTASSSDWEKSNDGTGVGGGIENVVEDTTPQLGGSLDVNGNSIVSVSNGDISLMPHGTGSVGIGTASPDQKLHVVGTSQFTDEMFLSHATPNISVYNASDRTVGIVNVGGGNAHLNVQGNIAVGGTVDGRDVAADGTKLDGIEALADVTDATNVSAAGAPIITSGAGAPGSTPTKVGDVYIDTTGDDAYIAVGTASSSDWEKSNDGTGAGGVDDGDKGDITVSGSGATWTIDNDAVTYAKIQDVSATDRILGRDTAGAGVIEELTPTAVRSMINVADGANAYVHPNHSGDVTSVADGATTIANGAVSLAKMANLAANTIIGRVTASTGVPESLTASNVRTIINVEDGADVTDTTNVTAAGALMDSEVDADIKTLSLPASTTISAFGASIIDDADEATFKATVNLEIGTDVMAYAADNATSSSTNTFTNKTIDANGTGNSISNIEVADLAAAAVVTAAETIAANNNDTTIPTSAAVKAYADSVGGGTVDTANSPNANEFARFTDADTIEGRTAAETRADLDLEIGTDVQAYNADLTSLATNWVQASASGASSLDFHEDTDNGTNKVTLIAPAAIGSDKTITFQDVTGTVLVTGGTDVAVADGGTGASTLTGLLQGNGTSAITGITNSSTVGQVLRVSGASTYAWGALDLGDTDAVTGTLPAGNLPTASTTASGVAEAAIASEVNTGTDAARYVTPDALAGSNLGTRVLAIQVLDGATTWTTGDGKAYVRIPAEMNGYNIIDVDMGVITKSTSGNPTVQIARGRQANATTAHAFADVLSTSLTIDANEFDSKDAGTPAVINASNDDLATGDILRVDIDTAGTGTAGFNLNIIAQLP